MKRPPERIERGFKTRDTVQEPRRKQISGVIGIVGGGRRRGGSDFRDINVVCKRKAFGIARRGNGVITVFSRKGNLGETASGNSLKIDRSATEEGTPADPMCPPGSARIMFFWFSRDCLWSLGCVSASCTSSVTWRLSWPTDEPEKPAGVELEDAVTQGLVEGRGTAELGGEGRDAGGK